MDNNEEDLATFLEQFGFAKEELRVVMDELNAFRSIPGTTISRYMNRIIDTIEEGERGSFLKGIILGASIRKAADSLEEPDLAEEEKRIDLEIDRLLLSRK
jgi:hypothetical protein